MAALTSMDLTGKKVIIRVDFNVPLDDDFKVTDDTRIQAAVPTIKEVLNKGAAVILMSHLGRPKNGPEEKFSLKHVVPVLADRLGQDVIMAEDVVEADAVKNVLQLQAGQVLLLENLRFHKEETKGDEGFAKKLAQFADVYINDAFGTAHRAHASTAIIADQFADDSKAFGLLMEKEVNNLNKVLSEPEKPFTAIIGGAKISGKIDVINQLIEKVDYLLIGGGMAYTFLKALGFETASSLVEDDKIDVAKAAIEKSAGSGTTLIIPVDSVCADAFSEDANTYVSTDQNVNEGWMGLDIGPKTIDRYQEVILKSKTILWNGPMGVFEMNAFQKGTVSVAEAVAEATSNGAYSLIGGGDSVAAVKQFGFEDKVSYISTGGGAMLEFMEGKVLPGIAAIGAGS